MKNESVHLESQAHAPHLNKMQSRIVDKLTEVVNGSMLLFHAALELHWNYQGPNFIAIHHFLDAHYKMLLTHFDEVAERAVTMGGAMKLMPSMHKQENEATTAAQQFNIDHYLTEAEEFCGRLKAAVKEADEDDVTHDLLVNYLGALEKDLWQLRSTLGQACDTSLSLSSHKKMVQ